MHFWFRKKCNLELENQIQWRWVILLFTCADFSFEFCNSLSNKSITISKDQKIIHHPMYLTQYSNLFSSSDWGLKFKTKVIASNRMNFF